MNTNLFIGGKRISFDSTGKLSPLLKIFGAIFFLLFGLFAITFSILFSVLLILPGVRQVLRWAFKRLLNGSVLANKFQGLSYFNVASNGAFDASHFQENISRPERDVSDSGNDFIEVTGTKI